MALPDVATTAISTLSLDPSRPHHVGRRLRGTTKKGVGYIVAAVEKTPKEEIAINAPGTLPQRKLGRYIDTFLGAQALSEALPSMPPGKERDRVKAALQSCVIEDRARPARRRQLSPDGWAGVLSDAFATAACTRPRPPARRTSATVEKRAEDHCSATTTRRRTTSARRPRRASSSTRWPARPRRRRAPAA